jgi:hypothetical protein
MRHLFHSSFIKLALCDSFYNSFFNIGTIFGRYSTFDYIEFICVSYHHYQYNNFVILRGNEAFTTDLFQNESFWAFLSGRNANRRSTILETSGIL